MGELIIRASYTDHQVIADLIAPGGAVAMRRPIDRLIADAQTAVARPQLATAARQGGVPYLIDPVTYLLQDETDPADSWVKRVPFADASAWAGADFDGAATERLVEQAVEFQMSRGATAIVAPYLYAESPEDEAFDASLRLMMSTRSYMRRNDVHLPLTVVLCARRQGFGPRHTWMAGIDRFVANAIDVDPHTIALCMTPLGADADGYEKVHHLFSSALRISDSGIPTVAWRQGMFGQGLVAAGLAGYETGAGTREKSEIRANISGKRPCKPGAAPRSGGPQPMVYLPGLGRSVQRKVAAALLGDLDTRARLICDDERCCPHGVESMLDQPVRHTVTARAEQMRELNALPHPSWRLHQVGKDAEQAVRTMRRASLVLKRVGVSQKLSGSAQEALHRVARHLRVEAEQRQIG